MISYKEYKLLRAVKKGKLIVSDKYHYQILSLHDDGYIEIVENLVTATPKGIRAYEEYCRNINTVILTVSGIAATVVIGIITIILMLSTK